MAGIQLAEALEKGAVSIKVVPKAKKNTIILENEIFIVHITAKAENNKANEAIEHYLSKITKKQVKVIKGKKSSKKLIRLA